MSINWYIWYPWDQYDMILIYYNNNNPTYGWKRGKYKLWILSNFEGIEYGIKYY